MAMTTTKRATPSELLRLAIIGIDEQITELSDARERLAAMINHAPTVSDVRAPATKKRRKITRAARKKMREAAKARWAKVREAEAKAKAQTPKAATKKAQPTVKPAKTTRAKTKITKSEKPKETKARKATR